MKLPEHSKTFLKDHAFLIAYIIDKKGGKLLGLTRDLITSILTANLEDASDFAKKRPALCRKINEIIKTGKLEELEKLHKSLLAAHFGALGGRQRSLKKTMANRLKIRNYWRTIPRIQRQKMRTKQRFAFTFV